MSEGLILNKKPRVLVTRRWPSAIESKLSEEFDAVFNRSDAPLTQPIFVRRFRILMQFCQRSPINWAPKCWIWHRRAQKY